MEEKEYSRYSNYDKYNRIQYFRIQNYVIYKKMKIEIMIYNNDKP
jgi:hypothetical protein